MHIADSLCCTAKTNTTLESNYMPVKIKKSNEVNNKSVYWPFVFLSIDFVSFAIFLLECSSFY